MQLYRPSRRSLLLLFRETPDFILERFDLAFAGSQRMSMSV
jgi:hypothetical protein